MLRPLYFEVKPLAKANHAREVKYHTQNRLIISSAAARTFSLFKKPKLAGASCMGLTYEWYDYSVKNVDFIDACKRNDPELIRRVNLMHRSLNDHRKNCGINGDITLFYLCENTSINSHGANKFYGLSCSSTFMQWNYYAKDDNELLTVSSCVYGDDQRRILRVPRKTDSFYNFDAIYDKLLENFIPGDFRVLTLTPVRNYKTTKFIGHILGMYCKLVDEVAQYHFYDSNAGEIIFTSFDNMQAFVREYVTMLCKREYCLCLGMEGFKYRRAPQLELEQEARVEEAAPRLSLGAR